MLDEQAIYEIQAGLRMVKRCWTCGQMKLVSEFPKYGSLTCTPCAADSANEEWFASLKRRVGVGT